MKVVNLFGGPGTGKSTIAADLFALMKWKNMNVELVTEYAKDLTWENRHDILKDQLYVLSKQNRKLLRLEGQVEWVITDSPIIMGLAYVPPDYFPNFTSLAEDVWCSYHNINFFLERKKNYHQVGRSQTEDEARSLDGKIENLMDDLLIRRTNIPANDAAKFLIMAKLAEEYGVSFSE